jgi:arabinofuranan 3-O-arabinosyltransferase
MATVDISCDRSAGAPLAQPVVLVAFALAVANAVYLLASWLQGLWPDGTGVPSDFVGVWAAGRLVLSGHPEAVYDWPVHKLVEQSAVGHPFAGYYGWHYPPTFLFVAVALSLLPYRIAYVVWAFGTFPAYLAAIRGIIGARVGYLLAAAFPAVLANVVVGQNGFLSAGLIGGALTLLERRPILAGALLGLLTYKPHLGLLFPVALIAGRQWRVFIAAAVVAILMAAASWLAFGSECWQAFVGNIGHTEHVFLSQGQADLNKLQTAFGLARTLGGSEALAWSIQIIVALAAAAVVAALWRKAARHQVPYEIKAAALGAGLLLATPYLYAYDLVVLAVPLAFLFRLGLTGGFLPYELTGIGLACLLVLIFPFVAAPTGFAGLLIVTALIARRALTRQRLTSPVAGTATPTAHAG